MAVFRFAPRWHEVAEGWEELRSQPSVMERLDQRDVLLEDYLRLMLSSIDAWTAFTPTVLIGATGATIANDTCRYVKLGRLVIADYRFRFSNLNGGTGTIFLSYPVTPADQTTGSAAAYTLPTIRLGDAAIADVSATAASYGIARMNDTTTWRVTDFAGSFFWAHNNPYTIAAGGAGTGDEFYGWIKYEAAS